MADFPYFFHYSVTFGIKIEKREEEKFSLFRLESSYNGGGISSRTHPLPPFSSVPPNQSKRQQRKGSKDLFSPARSAGEELVDANLCCPDGSIPIREWRGSALAQNQKLEPSSFLAGSVCHALGHPIWDSSQIESNYKNCQSYTYLDFPSIWYVMLRATQFETAHRS